MSSVFRYRELIRNLVFKDLKLKYRDSILGFLWSLANPLLVISVYSFVFGHLASGWASNVCLFSHDRYSTVEFLCAVLMMSTGSIIDNGNLIAR